MCPDTAASGPRPSVSLSLLRGKSLLAVSTYTAKGRKLMFRRALLLAGLAVVFAGAASAATEKFHATLNAASEVPPGMSGGSGQATASLDTVTHVLSYDVTYAGLSPPASQAYINGPAPAGRTAGVIMSLGMNPTGT